MESKTDLAAYEQEALSVTQALEQTNAQLSQMGRVLVVGELSQLTQRNHWYFSIKDEQSVLDCVMFASLAHQVEFTPVLGQKGADRGHAFGLSQKRPHAIQGRNDAAGGPGPHHGRAQRARGDAAC